MPPGSEQKQPDNSSDTKMFSDEDEEDSEEDAHSESCLQENEAAPFHIPVRMKQMKITELLNSVAYVTALTFCSVVFQ